MNLNSLNPELDWLNFAYCENPGIAVQNKHKKIMFRSIENMKINIEIGRQDKKNGRKLKVSSFKLNA